MMSTISSIDLRQKQTCEGIQLLEENINIRLQQLQKYYPKPEDYTTIQGRGYAALQSQKFIKNIRRESSRLHSLKSDFDEIASEIPNEDSNKLKWDYLYQKVNGFAVKFYSFYEEGTYLHSSNLIQSLEIMARNQIFYESNPQVILDFQNNAKKRIHLQEEDIARNFERLKHLGFIREVFISYAWGGESEEVVEEIDRAFQAKNINIMRDNKDIEYKMNIKEFMQKLGRAKCILLIISDRYLKSRFCMNELMEIEDRGDFIQRIFPIVLRNVNIYEAAGRLQYIRFWEQEKDILDRKLREGTLQHKQSITQALELYAKISERFDGLIERIVHLNTLTTDVHRESNFETLIQAVKSRLGR